MYTLTLTLAAYTHYYEAVSDGSVIQLTIPAHTAEIHVDDAVARVLRIEDGTLLYTGSDTLTLEYYDPVVSRAFREAGVGAYYYTTLTFYSPTSGEYHSRLTAYGTYDIPMTMYYGRGFGVAGELVDPHTTMVIAPDISVSDTTQTLLTGYSIESILLGFLLVLFAVMTLFRPRR